MRELYFVSEIEIENGDITSREINLFTSQNRAKQIVTEIKDDYESIGYTCLAEVNFSKDKQVSKFEKDNSFIYIELDTKRLVM